MKSLALRLLGLILLCSGTCWGQVPLLTLLQQPPLALAGRVAGSTSPWVVYSDRDNNPTYQQASLAVRFKNIQFGDAFYVLAERDGFLELVRYDPALKIGTIYHRRLLKNRKAAQYVGWAPKSHLLLTNQAPPDSTGVLPTLYCPALASRQVLTDAARFLRHDSLRLFAGPHLDKPLSPRLRLYELAYIFKLSASGNEALLGRADWFSADSASAMLLGWAPLAALQALGQGWFLEADTGRAGRAAYPLFDSAASALQNQPDSLLSAAHFPAVAWSRSPARLPVLKKSGSAARPAPWEVGLPLPLLDSSSYILNVNGQRLTQRQATNWQDRAQAYNLIYVVEDSPAMYPYWGELVNVVQTTVSRLQDQPLPTEVRLGSVLYHRTPPARGASGLNQLTIQPLTRDLARAVDGIGCRRPVDSRRPPSMSQPIQGALEQAFKLLAEHAGENNLIVLVGISGDARNIAQAGVIRRGLRASEARILSFQVAAPADTVANSFVLQSQQLVLQSAREGSKLKRERLVNAALVIPDPVYTLQLGPQNVYRLAFPQQSMVPGWVLFPPKKKVLPLSLLQATTDSLLVQLRFDTQQTRGALEQTFAAMSGLRGRLNPQVNQGLRARHEPPVTTLTPATLALRPYPFFSRAYAHPADSAAGFRQLRLVPPHTYEVLGQWLSLLAADELDPARRSDRRELRDRFAQLSKYLGSAPGDTTALSVPLSQLLGLPVRHPLLTHLRLADLKNATQLSPEVWGQLLALLRERRDRYLRVPAASTSRLTSNGSTYYWLSEDLFR